MRLHRRQQGIEFSRCQAGYFLQRARAEHRIETRIDPRVERFALGLKKQRAELALRQQRRWAFAMPVGERAPGRLNNFQRAGDARAVARLQTFGGRRIAPRQLRMQGLDAVALQRCTHALADLGRDRRHRRQAARQRLEVKTGAANKDRQAVLRPRLGQHPPRVRHPRARGIVHGCVDMAVEPVRHERLLLRRRPCGDDAEIAIDLHGIGVDHDAAGFLGKLERERRLAAGGRPCDKHGLKVLGIRIHLNVSRRHAHLQSRRPRARPDHRRRRAGRAPFAGISAMAVRRSRGRYPLRRS